MKITRDVAPKGSKNRTVEKGKANDPDGVNGKNRKKYSIHLTSPEDVRRLLCEVINELRKSNESNLCSRSSRIISAATVLLDVFRQNDLEQRVRELESYLAYGGDKQ